MINEILNEVHRSATLSFDPEGDLTKVFSVDGLIGVLA
jgi:hypothetical protein